MVMALLLAGHVQLPLLALWVPIDIQVTSIVRRFERFLSNSKVNVRKYFKPFIVAMQASLGHECAYIVIDCTKSGPNCRTVMIGLWYHNTVIPLIWKTIQGSKGHVKGRIQKLLLEELYPLFKHHPQVIVLGDAEFSNETVISWLKKVNWHFIFRFQSTYHIKLQDGTWKSARDLADELDLSQGDVHHFSEVCFTQKHKIEQLTITLRWEKGYKDPIFLVSNLPPAMQPHIIYEMRFAIETLFGQFKSRAFRLASTHIDDPEHIDKLILAMAIATCITLGLGTHLLLMNRQKMIDRTERRDLSLFQLGYRYFIRLLVLDQLKNFKIKFDWNLKLPKAGWQKTK